MTDAAFTPTLFLKEACPFCLKVRLFLLESGQLEQVRIREFAPGTPEEESIRTLLTPVVEKISFPAAQIADRQYLADSDAIIAHFAEKDGIDPATLPTYQSYVGGALQRMGALYRENVELKQRLGQGVLEKGDFRIAS